MEVGPSEGCLLLAQTDLSTVGGQLTALTERLTSPWTVLGLVMGLTVLFAAFANRRSFETLAALQLFAMSFPLHFGTLLAQQNTLIEPLQTFRNIGRPISFVLLLLVALRAFAVPRSEARTSVSATAVSFLAFQCVYVAELMVFDDFAKGALATISIVGMFVAFAVGMGRQLSDRDSARRGMEVFLWLGLAFVAVNFAQLALGFSNSFLGGRFVGTGGNAQFTGLMCMVLILPNLYLRTDSEDRPFVRQASLLVVVVAGAFLVLSGSRTNALATAVGVLVMFRSQFGRLLAVTVLGLVAVQVASLLGGDDASGGSRLLSTTDTRTQVWIDALVEFSRSPIIGNLPQFGEGYLSGVESSYLRALSAMGIIGGVLIALPTVLMVRDLLVSNALAARRPDLGGLCRFHCGISAALLIANAFEGIAFGVLTLPVMTMYTVFSLGHFLRDEARGLVADSAEESIPSAYPA